jgi:hypothetical protein
MKLNKIWSGRGDLNARPPAPKGAGWFPMATSAFAKFLKLQQSGDLLSLKKQTPWLE